MQHRYVGDVGDFGKFGLLRWLTRKKPECCLGVAWYLIEDENHNADGKHIRYLQQTKPNEFAACDDQLFDILKKICVKQRNLKPIERGGVLPKNTLFHSVPVPSWRGREEWFSGLQQQLAAANLIFADPDNGLVFPMESPKRPSRRSRKHARWEEVQNWLNDGKNVIAYHHLGRQKGGHVEYIRQCLAKMRKVRAFAIRFWRGTSRAFFVLPANDKEYSWLRPACEEFTEKWQQHCKLIPK